MDWANRFIPQLKQIWETALIEHKVTRIEVANHNHFRLPKE